MTVALTQSEGRLEGLESRLRQRGLEVWRVPLVRTQTRQGADLSRLLDCPWWLFSSVAAVRAVLELGGSLQGRRLGAVGEATKEALEQAGGLVELLGSATHAASLAEAFIALGEAGCVGLPQGHRALPTLARGLSEAGHQVRAVIVYDTFSLPWPDHLETPDLTLLASPSAAEALPVRIGANTHCLALGPTTARCLRERGWPHTTLPNPSEEEVVATIEQILERKCGRRHEVNSA
ncbi:uroporphyrinogen-III synthase [uncultured Meiothermus sp.]|jgi:uroporphyrinogen-III synthase|uniref:uroporphyrinogen-III synthase n=1 Tax=uncultured Meiothermus sp. TaxID=157471 RepID=UPI00260D07B5|nr:uroporphyrinogen-III synthase [uncultured Meiothermus sp.]